MDEDQLPPIFRYEDDVPYTAEQLAPTIARLRAALSDLRRAGPPPAQRLAAAWTRVAELRLPRKAVPGPVLAEVERLVALWDAHAPGGIGRYAATLSPERVEHEARLIGWMLDETEAAAQDAPAEPLVPTE